MSSPPRSTRRGSRGRRFGRNESLPSQALTGIGVVVLASMTVAALGFALAALMTFVL